MQHKIFCVREFIKTESATVVQRAENLKYRNQQCGLCWGAVYCSSHTAYNWYMLFKSIFLNHTVFFQFLSGLAQVGQFYKPKMQHTHKTKRTESNIYFNMSINLKIIANCIFSSVRRPSDSFHDIRRIRRFSEIGTHVTAATLNGLWRLFLFRVFYWWISCLIYSQSTTNKMQRFTIS